MTAVIPTPKVFISYSWKPPEDQLKAIALAERLQSNGVHVVIDVWNLVEGLDKYQFMEKMVTDPDICRVLLICNKQYAEKADGKKGGVGIESLIISDEIYSQADQTKFIPVIFEFSPDGKPYTPTFVKSRIYVDLSNDNVYEEEYEKLLRNILGKPIFKRPPLGKIPKDILNDDAIFLPTKNKVNTLERALINEKKNAVLLIQDYLDTFSEAVHTTIPDLNALNPTNLDEYILKQIDNSEALLHDYVDFLETLLLYSNTIEVERIHKFFEKLLELRLNNDSDQFKSTQIGYLYLDGIRYFYFELFLVTTALLIRHEKYIELGYLLNTSYVVDVKAHHKALSYSFSSFKKKCGTLNDYMNKTQEYSMKNGTMEKLKERTESKFKFEDLQQADLLLYYVSLTINFTNIYNHEDWYPELASFGAEKFELMKKATSQRYFEKIKHVFGVNTKEELISQVNGLLDRTYGTYNPNGYRTPHIQDALNIRFLCSEL